MERSNFVNVILPTSGYSLYSRVQEPVFRESAKLNRKSPQPLRLHILQWLMVFAAGWIFHVFTELRYSVLFCQTPHLYMFWYPHEEWNPYTYFFTAEHFYPCIVFYHIHKHRWALSPISVISNIGLSLISERSILGLSLISDWRERSPIWNRILE